MREAKRREPYTTATVPLNRLHLVQPELFHQTITHFLPKVVPGEEAVIFDADEWQRFNGRRGIVTAYSYFTGLHTIAFEGKRRTFAYGFLGREITKSK